MLRRLRPPRAVASLGPRRYSTRPPGPAVVQIQRVRFLWKRPKISTVLVTVGTTYALYEILMHTLVLLIDEEDLEDITEEEREELEQPVFIPFPGFTRMVQPRPYRSTDPEWQTYVKVSKDKELLKSIRGSLAEMARRMVATFPQFKNQANISKYWLDIQYPPNPPPSFVRQGLSLGGGNGIAWAEQAVEPLAVFWTRQALWPSALAVALWSFTSTLVTQNVMSIAKFFRHEPPTDPLTNMQQTIEKIHQQMKKQSGKPGSVSPPIPTPGGTGEAGEMDEGPTTGPLPPIDKRPAAGTPTTPETLSTGAGMDNDTSNVVSPKDLYMIRTVQEHTSGPWDSFKKSLVQKWRRPQAFPPRGSIRVSGLVEINVPTAIVTLDCIAWWDPQTAAFDPKTTTIRLRTVRPKIQSPMG